MNPPLHNAGIVSAYGNTHVLQGQMQPSVNTEARLASLWASMLGPTLMAGLCDGW